VAQKEDSAIFNNIMPLLPYYIQQ